jgi:hypothetical protein
MPLFCPAKKKRKHTLGGTISTAPDSLGTQTGLFQYSFFLRSPRTPTCGTSHGNQGLCSIFEPLSASFLFPKVYPLISFSVLLSVCSRIDSCGRRADMLPLRGQFQSLPVVACLYLESRLNGMGLEFYSYDE